MELLKNVDRRGFDLLGWSCGEVTYVNLTFQFQWIFDRELKQKEPIEFIHKKNDQEFMHCYEVVCIRSLGKDWAKTWRRVNKDWVKSEQRLNDDLAKSERSLNADWMNQELSKELRKDWPDIEKNIKRTKIYLMNADRTKC